MQKSTLIALIFGLLSLLVYTKKDTEKAKEAIPEYITSAIISEMLFLILLLQPIENIACQISYGMSALMLIRNACYLAFQIFAFVAIGAWLATKVRKQINSDKSESNNIE